MKDENYYQVCGWMLNRLKLKGVALQVYAIIYGFTQDGASAFNGSLKYLEECTGSSKPTVMKALEELVNKNYIFKKSEQVQKNITFNTYKVNLEAINRDGKETLQPVKKLDGGGKETLQPVKKLDGGGKETLPGGGKETLPNNNILDNNNYNNIERKKEGATSINAKIKNNTTTYNEIVKNYTDNAELKETVLEFVKMRKFIKKPLTDRALNILLKKLDSLAGNEEGKKIAILEQSIANSWQSIYELKEDKKPSYQSKKLANNVEMDADKKARLEKLKEIGWDNEF